ncbi:MAG: metallophosphoesterase family protein [Candidatus Fimimonas sp.]
MLAVIATAYSLIVALFWLALRVNWSGISKALGADKNQSFFVMQTPLVICIFLWLVFAFAFVSMLVWKRKLPSIIAISVSGVFTVIIIVVIALGACDYMSFILPKFFRSLLVALALTLFALLLFFPPVSKCKKCTALKWTCLGLALLLCVLVGYNVQTNGFSYGAVVYAVEDDYQIVFSTSAKSVAWVEIDGENYYDLYAGSMKSEDLVHKISVPQEKLDAAKSYKICAQQMIYRGPFGGYKGKVISKQYNFRPVNSSDGLVYYSMSDVHGARKGAVNAALSVENLDFLVLLGDNLSMIDSESDAQFANLLANDVTHGEIPCVYARGNHEIKGNYAEQLHKYVGSKNGNFYYWFTMSDVFGITLDIGEDHDDDWWEYYGTAQFDLYRGEQTEMLKEITTQKPYEGFNYKLVCCHIPVQFINSRGNHVQTKTDWTNYLNLFQPDLVVSGHQHTLFPFLEGKIDVNEDGRLIYNSNYSGVEGKLYGAKGGVTDFRFNSFIVGRRGATQKDEVSSLNNKDHIGLVTVADIAGGKQTSYYVNSKHQKVSVAMPFFQSQAQTEFVTDLKTCR